MKIASQLLLTTASLLVLSCTYAGRNEAHGTGDEIIVKFAANQAINDIIVRAFDDADAESSLEESVQELSEELGVPFVYSQLTSGREIVIEVPPDRVYDRIAGLLRGSADVENVTIAPRTTGDVPSEPDELLVSVDRSNIQFGPGVDANQIGTQLVGDDRFPVNCEIHTDGRLVVTPDFERLVRMLAAELASRPDVDYAQPNYRVRHYDNTR